MTTRNLAAAVLAGGAVLALGGCMTTSPAYRGPAAGAPTATLAFQKSMVGTSFGGVNGWQNYEVAPDEFCDTLRTAAAFDLYAGRERAAAVAAGRPLVVRAAARFATGGVVYMAQHDGRLDISACTNGVRFTPREGGSYQVKQNASFGSWSCSITVVDIATGAAPEGLEVLDPATCRAREEEAAEA